MSTEQKYKMRIHFYSKPASKGAGYEYEEICYDTELPYIPRIGDGITVTETQDICVVEDVIFIPYEKDEFARINVHLKEPDRVFPFKRLEAEGWKLA